MQPFAEDRVPDASLAFLRRGNLFVTERCRRHDTDLLFTRLMLTPCAIAYGREAAETFYTPGRFTRRGAVPRRVLKLLQDEGSVQTLDGAAHRRRRAMFLSLMQESELDRLAHIFETRWELALPAMRREATFRLEPRLRRLLTETALRWAYLPADPVEVERETEAFSAMIDGTGAVGPSHWRARRLRIACERRMRDAVDTVRAGHLDPPAGSALAVFALGGDEEGGRLEARIAAVEIINILRPIVAVARYIVFAALALDDHAAGGALKPDDPEAITRFAHEVRRYYPFLPVMGGRVLEPFEWRGRQFGEGDWMLLDLWGTCNDPRLWDEPRRFDPDRFIGREDDPYGFIPQGGGSMAESHRCPGEWATMRLMETAIRLMLGDGRPTLAMPDMGVDLTRLPARPPHGLPVRIG